MRYQGLLVLVVVGFLSATLRAEDDYTADERNHWSLRARSSPTIPQFEAAADRDWVINPVDAFILAKLHENKLQPAPATDRAALLRRVYFDLTGLPPTPAQVEAFVKDERTDAYERLVDQLLQSPHYGERWGQHWLDVVRFAETEGYEYDKHHPFAWRFRDYVIQSLNDDKPFDQFVREQLAGDEIAPEDRSALVAVGFLRLGPVRRNAGNTDVAFSRNEVLTEMTDTVGVTFLGLTLGCARCHDHMFDPIRQKDYYRVQAFLASAHEHDITLTDVVESKETQARREAITARIKKIEEELETATGTTRRGLERELKDAEREMPPPASQIFSVNDVAEKRTAIHVLKRGVEDKPGDRVGPRVPGVLLEADAPELPADASQPRAILANWITSPNNPLTARVIVNRVWQFHFGRGIVGTPNDFGVNGERPSHPELLDYLANQLVAGGWKLKSLHRAILLSSTYRQASYSPNGAAADRIDPDNRLLSRFPRRRLEAEEIRDAMLAVSGRLNPRIGGASIMIPVDSDLVKLLYKPSQWAVTEDKSEHDRRSVYLIAKRNLRLPFMEVFDQPALQGSCARRESSTHAPQALELLNGPLANDLARSFAARLKREAGADSAKQIDVGFRLSTGRPPTETERRAAAKFLETESLGEFALALFNLSEFLYVK